jgi:hypothetical protein
MKYEQTTQTRHNQMLNLFLNGYTDMVAHMDAYCQKGLKEAAPLAFTKWYYTAIAADTLLSPANIVGQDLNSQDEGKEYLYTLRLSPEGQELKESDFTLLTYSVAEHPFVEDLRRITDFCIPDCKMDENLFFLEEDRPILLNKLAHESEFYLEYLTRLAWRLGLFVYMPAIHTKKVQRAPYCDAFFDQTNEEILKMAAEAACELASERFSISMDLDHGIATPSFFKECLTSPIETDQIFIQFYKQVDIDIEEIWKTQPADLTEDDKAIISSFLFTGIMIDKWFIFPMSAFFGMIRPISFTPIQYFNLVNNLSALLIMEHNIGAELFTSPSYYSLTPLGKALWGDNGIEDEKYKIPEKLPYEEILEALERETEINRFEQVFYMGPEKDILTIQVSMKEDPDFWKTIEIATTTPLDEFCRDLAAAFAVDEVTDYLLSVPDENQFPVDYTPQGSKRSVNKTTEKTLEDLYLDKGSVFSLTFEKTNQILLEVTDIFPGDPFILYPRIKRQSSKVTEIEKVDEIF